MASREDPSDPHSPPPEGTLTRLVREVFSGDTPATIPWDAALQPGARVGRFELLREIGRGGYGAVWEARDVALKRKVAFKAIRASNPGLADEHALAEAETAAHLAHPNIVTLFDMGKSEHGPYLVMELLHGESLSRRLSRGPVPAGEALRIAVEIARGLAHAHSRGVVHRDLTPGNVFLCEGGAVKILDLGIAQVLGRDAPGGGTPGYMSPERIRGDREDPRSDVHSLGVILDRMLHGDPPMPRSGPGAPAAPSGLAALVARMRSDDPALRPSDAGRVLEALEEIRTGPSRTKPKGRRVALAIGLGVAGAVAAGALAWSGANAGTVARVSVTLADPVIAAGASTAARAETSDADGAPARGTRLAWRSGDGAVASVDATGRVTGRAPGTTSIEASAGGSTGSASVAVIGPEWELAWASDLHPPPPGSITRNGGLPGQSAARVEGRPAWYQTSDWSMLFVPLDLSAEVDAFAVQADFFLPSGGDWGRATSLVVFTSPGVKDPADLVHGRGITIDQRPAKNPTFSWGVPEGWTTRDVEATGALDTPITGRWRTLRIEGSKQQCWLRALLDGRVVHTSTKACLLSGAYVMLGSLNGAEHPVNGAWSALRVFRGIPVARMEVLLHDLPSGSTHYAKAQAVLLGADGSRISGRVVTWEVSDPAIATVDLEGAVTARGAGEVTLTARCEGRSASAVLPVTSPRPAGR